MLYLKQSINKQQNGAALVEFAILVPFLFLLVLGIIEFGYAFYHLNILNKSVQDGARYFSDSQRARNGNVVNPINTSIAGNSEVDNTKRLAVYGNIQGTGEQLLPGFSIDTVDVFCAEENRTDSVCAETTQHIRVRSAYQHDFIVGCALQGILEIFFGSTDILCSYTLTASSVLRVE